jgi:hypothetical protein
MSLLATIAGLLALVLLLIGVLGLLAPRLFRNKTTGEVPRRMQLLPGIAIMVVLLLIIAGWADDRAAHGRPCGAGQPGPRPRRPPSPRSGSRPRRTPPTSTPWRWRPRPSPARCQASPPAR